MTHEDSKLIRLLCRACLSAGRKVLGYYRPLAAAGIGGEGFARRLDARLKDRAEPRTVVTAADLKSEKAIMSTFRRSKLDCSFLSEEAGRVAGNAGAAYRIIIDSLDGSKNFTESTMGLFGISIGVEREGRLAAGAIYLPFFGELLVAQSGLGAFFKRCRDGHIIRTWKLKRFGRVARGPKLERARICLARGAADPAVMCRPPLSGLLTGSSEAVNFASCTVGLVSVALGRIDALVLPRQKYWDFAGGLCILRELAAPFGIWRNFWRDPVHLRELAQATEADYFDIAVARNSRLFDEILGAIRLRSGEESGALVCVYDGARAVRAAN